MQINRWAHLSTSPWEILFCCSLFRERIDQKNFLLCQQITELYSLFDGLKNSFGSELPDISKKSRRRNQANSKRIAKRYALQVNAIKS